MSHICVIGIIKTNTAHNGRLDRFSNRVLRFPVVLDFLSFIFSLLRLGSSVSFLGRLSSQVFTRLSIKLFENIRCLGQFNPSINTNHAFTQSSKSNLIKANAI